VTRHKVIELSNGNRYHYQLPWDGRTRLRGTLECAIAFDTETEALSDADLNRNLSIPRVALATVSTGSHSYFLHPSQLADWVLLHRGEHLVGQNVRFDFWVVDQYLRAAGRPDAVEAWWQFPTEHRLHDTLLLDQLIRLGQGVGTAVYSKDDSSLSRRDLGAIARDYVGVDVDKSDPYRMRYGELLGVPASDWASCEQGFFDYAIVDAVVTYLVYKRQAKVAGDLMRKCRSHAPRDIAWQAERKYGYLTEALQTAGTLALAHMSRRGIRTSPDKVAAYEACVRADMERHLEEMMRRNPEVFIYRDQCTPKGALSKRKNRQPPLPGVRREVMLTPKGKTPRLRQPELRDALEKIAARLGVPPVLSDGKKGGTSLSAKAWAVHAGRDSFIREWSSVTKKAKLLSFFDLFRESSVIHATYNPLMRTGRVSACRPNITQAPRDKDFRGLFVARDRHLLYTVDYSFIELRAMAAICTARFGRSVLADVIKAGKDPHSYTTSLIMGVPYADVLAGLAAEKAAIKAAEKQGLPPPASPFTAGRQSAKAVGFGLIGGLGSVKLAAYAKASYGVDMTVEEAAALRHKMITEVYPEFGTYLADSSLFNMCFSLGVTERAVCRAFDIPLGDAEKLQRATRAASKVLRGEPFKADGTPYKEAFVNRTWEACRRLASSASRLDSSIREALRQEVPSPRLEKAFFGGPAFTLTGRVRGGCTYTQIKNSPFQGLAADGAKLALWRLLRAGFSIIAFIHDEIIVELPAATAAADAPRVDAILNAAMEEVMQGLVPSGVEGRLAECWQK